MGEKIVYHNEKLEIAELRIREEAGKLEIKMAACCHGEMKHYSFRNISSLRISGISYPMQLQAFHIIDHSLSGWEANSRYEFQDYEDETLHFYCESFEVY